MRTLALRRGEDRRLRAGHLWVFSNEVDVAKTPISAFRPGEEALVTDSHGAPLGCALVNPATLICARIYSRRPGVAFDADLIASRVADALALRGRLYDGPWYRLVFGEGDSLPGLVVDRFGSHLAAQVTTAGMEAHRKELSEVLHDLLKPASIFWDNSIASRALEGLAGESTFESADGTPLPDTLEVPENGCTYAFSTLGGQKTGWYYDQRENRARAASFCKDADVLDAFSYVGGFGVAAARAGASSVAFLDASAPALELAKGNLGRNAPACPGDFLCGDAFDTLKRLAADGRTFDVVSIDPPAFIKRRRDMKQGLEAYRRLNALAAGLVREGGLLVSSSCSQLLSADELRSAVAHAAARHGLQPRILHTGFQGPDHPVHASMPETAYLKCLMVQLHR